MKSCMDEEPGASVRKSRANAGHVEGDKGRENSHLRLTRDCQEFAAL